MIRKLIKRSWKLLPPAARKRIVRLTQPRFTASAAAVVIDREGKVLLLEHLLRPYSGWGFPGGFIDRGETPEAAVIREVFEETGIEITDVRLVEVRTVDRHLEFIYSARGEGPGQILSGEILDLRWYAADEVPEGLTRRERRILEQVLAGEH